MSMCLKSTAQLCKSCLYNSQDGSHIDSLCKYCESGEKTSVDAHALFCPLSSWSAFRIYRLTARHLVQVKGFSKSFLVSLWLPSSRGRLIAVPLVAVRLGVCQSHGRTLSCATALIRAWIRRVLFYTVPCLKHGPLISQLDF